MSNYKCFFLEPTDEDRLSLRRYVSSSECSLTEMKMHDAKIFWKVAPDQKHEHVVDKTLELWPKYCACGYEFKDTDTWQVFNQSLYKRQDNGELVTLWDDIPGAMWYADWMLVHRPDTPEDRWWRGPDNRCLMVRGPNKRDWCPDQRASNCDKPNDNIHKCWVRKGIPPNVTVNKDGLTCGAGAGSIWFGKDWHGFLENGILVER